MTLEKDPTLAWCEQHLEELEKYHPAFIAIHPDLGVVAFNSDPDLFQQELDRLSGEVRGAIACGHTVMFVRRRR